MSLINDALKRAGATPPPPNPETPPPPLQPVAEAATRPTWPVVLLPVGLILVFALAGVLLWQGVRGTRRAASGEILVAAREQPAATAKEAPTTATEPSTPPVDVVMEPASPAIQTAASAPALQASQTAERAQTNLPPAEPARPAFPALKLQGIYYRLSKPSVMINNKTLFVGETIGDTKVVTISPSSVTVEWNGQTRVLTMP